MTTLEKLKMSLRITTNAYDDELMDLMEQAIADIGITDVDVTGDAITKPLIQKAVFTYVRLNFGQPDDYDRLKESYDEQKSQLLMSSGYTNWGDHRG